MLSAEEEHRCIVKSGEELFCEILAVRWSE